jgi:Family of unknown function (DUF6193)
VEVDRLRVDDEWARFLAELFEDDPRNDDWFHRYLRPLLAAASKNEVLRRLYPYQAMNQLAFSRTWPPADDLPAINVGSVGLYAVLSRPGPSGELLLEDTSVSAAVHHVATLLR